MTRHNITHHAVVIELTPYKIGGLQSGEKVLLPLSPQTNKVNPL